MKSKHLKSLLISVTLLAAVGCKTPADNVSAVHNNIQATELRISTHEDTLVRQANGFVTAAEFISRTVDEGKTKDALQSTLTRAHNLLNDAGYALTFNEKTEFEILAERLISDEVAKNKEAQRQLVKKDKELSNVSKQLTTERQRLEDLRKEYEQAVTALQQDNARKDRKIAEQKEKLSVWNTIGRVTKWATWSFVIMLVLPLLTPLFPTFAPLLTGIGKFIGWCLKSILQIPGALAGAAVVARDEYLKIRQVATDHIIAQEDIRKTLKKEGVITKEKHDELLREYITEADGTASVVDSIRREQHLIR